MVFESSRIAGFVLLGGFIFLLVSLHIWRLKYRNQKHPEVDPIAEAEVYIAYGGKAKAIEILKKARLTFPEGTEITKKLNELQRK